MQIWNIHNTSFWINSSGPRSWYKSILHFICQIKNSNWKATNRTTTKWTFDFWKSRFRLSNWSFWALCSVRNQTRCNVTVSIDNTASLSSTATTKNSTSTFVFFWTSYSKSWMAICIYYEKCLFWYPQRTMETVLGPSGYGPIKRTPDTVLIWIRKEK